MGRTYVINGETLVKIKGNQANSTIYPVKELGLASGEVRIVPRFVHRDVKVDDFGPDIPPEVLVMIAEVSIMMTLIHYDPVVLEACVQESLGGGTPGTLNGAGFPLGGGLPVFSPGCHYISLNLLSPQLNLPWRFRSSYLSQHPIDLPLGTSASATTLTWRAIPYTIPNSNGEVVSAGAVLWDHGLDS